MSSGKIKEFKTLSSQTSELNQVQNRIKQALTPILRSNIIDGVLLESVELKTGQKNLINHKLDRKVKGYIIVDQNASSTFWRLEVQESLKKQFIDLQCSANVTVTIWIF